ncbi:GMP synthase-like glutamine amidotransferase/poly-gamma-glutamate capsule biosynthesis protein CapA/YwtB (metallophosphatase superfamily) [Bradyrhizobium sp. S3.2.12]
MTEKRPPLLRPIVIVKTGDAFDQIRDRRNAFEDWISDVLASAACDHPILVVDPRVGQTIPDSTSISGMVITGSHAKLTDNLPWLEELSRSLLRAVRDEVPTLGICFGHQVLAECLGGRLAQRSNGAEVASVQVTVTPEGREDALFRSLPRAFTGPVVHWQSAVRLPADAVILAHSPLEPHQAFRIGRCAWGVQFHPEIPESIVARYLDVLAPRLLRDGHDVDELRAQLVRAPYSMQVLRNFARYVASQEPCRTAASPQTGQAGAAGVFEQMKAALPTAEVYDVAGSTATNVADGFTMIAVGDLILSRALTKTHGRELQAVIDILRNADVTFGNLETLILDARSSKGYPQAGCGCHNVSLPEVAPDLKAMGFNLLGRANNHAFDWGVEGMRETSRALDIAGIVHAGAGEDLAQAAAARFLESARGRIALVSFASTYIPVSRAAEPAAEAPGRPGLSPLTLTRSIVVLHEMLEQMQRVRDALPGFKAVTSDPNRLLMAGIRFKAGDKGGYSFEPDAVSVANILRNVRRAKQYSDFCIATNHGHEPGNWSDDIPDYEQAFARKVIDSGADAYVVHGPHRLRGIEVYKGRPILYGVGNFFFDALRTPVGADIFAAYGKDARVDTDADVTAAEESTGYETADGFTDPVFYETVIPVCRFERNQLAEIRLVPVELGHSMRMANRGIPRIAPPPYAAVILQRLQKLSEPFGTRIMIRDNVGIIRPLDERNAPG